MVLYEIKVIMTPRMSHNLVRTKRPDISRMSFLLEVVVLYKSITDRQVTVFPTNSQVPRASDPPVPINQPSNHWCRVWIVSSFLGGDPLVENDPAPQRDQGGDECGIPTSRRYKDACVGHVNKRIIRAQMGLVDDIDTGSVKDMSDPLKILHRGITACSGCTDSTRTEMERRDFLCEKSRCDRLVIHL